MNTIDPISFSKWFRPLRSRSQHLIRLLIFPHAGGSTAAFRDWCTHLQSSLDVRLLQLPGRDSRFGEELITDWREIVDIAAAVIASSNDVPHVLFGHSMGSFLAFETARRLVAVHGIKSAALIVSGRGAPHIIPRVPLVQHLSNDDLVLKLSELYGGIPSEVLTNRELINLMARVLRADLTVVEGYKYTGEGLLECPIAAFGGEQDPWVTREELASWRGQTSGSFVSEQFAGDHFYFRDEGAQMQLLSRVRKVCEQVIREARPSDKATIRYSKIASLRDLDDAVYPPADDAKT